MAKKDDDYAATHPAMPPGRGMTDLMRNVPVQVDATTSMTDAIVSVSKVSKADIDRFLEQLKRLDMSKHKAVAQGIVAPTAVGVDTRLSTEVAKGMASVSYQTREVQELRAHEKDVAGIEAGGPVKAEIANRVLTGLGIVLGLIVAWYLGKQGFLAG